MLEDRQYMPMQDTNQSVTPNNQTTQPASAESSQAQPANTPQPQQNATAGSKPPTKNKSLLFLLPLFFILLILALAAVWFLKGSKNGQKIAVQITNSPLKKINVQLSWFNTAEFAGFFIAQDKGFYKNAGLDVHLLEAAPPKTSQDAVIAKEAQFGVAGIDGILLARESGHPMKALAAIYQQSPATFITLKSSGINKPQDFAGKRVTIECGTNVEYQQRAVLKILNLADKIKENCSTYSIDQLLNNQTDVFAGFVTNESIELEQAGHPVNSILVTDYGVNYYPNLIYTSDQELQSDPQTAKAFVTATLEGYKYALAHPDEAVASTMQRKSGQGPLSLALQKQTMAVQSPLIFTGKTPLGWMDKTVIEQGIQILLEQKIIKHSVDAESIFTNEYVGSN